MMDYLQKNDEDDNGVPMLVTLFMATLVLFDPLFSIIYMYQAGRAFAAIPAVGVIHGMCELGFLTFIFYTCFCFYKRPERAVKVAKTFLVIRFFYLTASILINFFHSFFDKNSIASGRINLSRVLI